MERLITWPGLREDAARLTTSLAPDHRSPVLPMLDDLSDSRKAHPPQVYTRLSALRRALDPGALFVGQHG